MKRIFGLVLSISVLLVFSACTTDEVIDTEDEGEDLSAIVEILTEKFAERIEKNGYIILLENEEFDMEGEFYSDRTFKSKINSQGIEISLVCGVEGEYSMSMGEELDAFIDYSDEEIAEMCDVEDVDSEFSWIFEGKDSDNYKLTEAEYKEKSKYFIVIFKDKKFSEMRIYKDGKKVEIIGEKISMVVEVLD
ncbi:MAG: hypothetical protein ACK5K7_04080 [Bacilli bacterium]